MRPILLDTDPGIDDAIAFAVLHHNCPERVKLIVSSYGNVPLARATENALTMREILDWDVPVLRGAHEPEDGRYADAAHIHGADGLGGCGRSYPADAAPACDYLDVLYRKLLELGEVDYLTIGPLTNLARLLNRFPDVVKHIPRVVTMGGGIGMGNVTKFAEFNIHCDAEAASTVFRMVPELVLLPLNVTTQIAFSLEEIERITAGNSEKSRAMRTILKANYHACIGYGEPGATMHDSTAALYLLFPELFRLRRCGIQVDCGSACYGETRLASGENVLLCTEADSQTLLDRIAEAVRE